MLCARDNSRAEANTYRLTQNEPQRTNSTPLPPTFNLRRTMKDSMSFSITGRA